ncbi:MAG TPA: hypothetical protein VFP21_10775 [Solirubrobacterales bacterium]|nr:hypothetical protein [Solirubrobacterales bacterium]
MSSLVISGGWSRPYARLGRLSKEAFGWPFGLLELSDEALIFRARWVGGSHSIVISIADLERVDERRRWMLAHRLLEFRTSDPQTDRMRFTSWPKALRALTSELASRGVPVVDVG